MEFEFELDCCSRVFSRVTRPACRISQKFDFELSAAFRHCSSLAKMELDFELSAAFSVTAQRLAKWSSISNSLLRSQ
jgi:hypothetical protein